MIAVSKALAINPDIGLREVLEISQSNQFDVVYSPTVQGPGQAVGGTIVKPAPAHEGASTSFAENGGDPDALPGDVSVAQLESFKTRFEDAHGKGQTGMAVLNHEDNGMVLTSRRSALEAKFADNGEIVAGENGGLPLDEAIQQYVNLTGRQLQFPTVY